LTVQVCWRFLNTAEGNGKRQGQQRAKFFDDARGSAFECAACLDASVAKGFVSIDRVRPGERNACPVS
jgi:four helix bundle protein